MSIAFAAADRAVAADEPIRVMVVDDAVVVRGLVARWIDGEPDMTVAASLRTGREAVDQIERSDADVVVLDIEMPELDGISALPLLLEKKRDLVVIMASTLTRRNAEVSLQRAGARRRRLHPQARDRRARPRPRPTFRRELIEKIRELGRRRRRCCASRCRSRRRPKRACRAMRWCRCRRATACRPSTRRRRSSCGRSRRSCRACLLIGSSTGGPQALTALIDKLRRPRSTARRS